MPTKILGVKVLILKVIEKIYIVQVYYLNQGEKCLNKERRHWPKLEKEEIKQFILERESINEEREMK